MKDYDELRLEPAEHARYLKIKEAKLAAPPNYAGRGGGDMQQSKRFGRIVTEPISSSTFRHGFGVGHSD